MAWGVREGRLRGHRNWARQRAASAVMDALRVHQQEYHHCHHNEVAGGLHSLTVIVLVSAWHPRATIVHANMHYATAATVQKRKEKERIKCMN